MLPTLLTAVVRPYSKSLPFLQTAYGIQAHMVLYNHNKAKLHTRYKEILPDDSVISITIWVLPRPTTERPHGYKYRLNYSGVDGVTKVRYDNETGKGDHKHIGTAEMPYRFHNPDDLVIDFLRDVERARGEL